MPLVQACINLQNRIWDEPNEFNFCLDQEAVTWNQIIARGGLEHTCAFQNRRRYKRPPWEAMPPEGEKLREFGSIVLPVDDGADNLIKTFRMPVGWDGVAEHVSCTYTGSGFEEGSGDITWRVKVGERWIPGFENILTQLNDLKYPYTDAGAYIRLLSLQYVSIYAAVAIGASGRLVGGRINAALTGYKYPKR